MTEAGRGIRLNDQQRLAWLRLIRSDRVGPATFRDLLNHYGTAAAALEALPELSRRGGAIRGLRIAAREDAEAEIAALSRLGGRLVAIGEPGYPAHLRTIDAPPPLLSVFGPEEIAARPAVAIVGARNASLAGRKMARKIAEGLGEAGLVVVSGLARGIDAAAHEAATETGTIAVLAGGLDHIYPPENEPLLQAIVASGGAAVTEMPLGWSPRARDFPRRNRLISGISLAVVVVEAAKRSGSLHTARFAAEQGRDVFAVPGSPLDPRAEGCNHLIREGATLTVGADDVIEGIAPLLGRPPAPPPQLEDADTPMATRPEEPDDTARARIIEALGPTPTSVDEIIRETGVAPAAVQLVLLELDLAGRLERHGGGAVSLA
ncbi:DNA-processing protein DprA [Amorphus orientalis]|uniref:DNA processing protein n=1 Tax=Amorphus orientalis TaxID=649198 RepID=A0AAE4AVT4_9HYPH|nr:DNA-processing protein DprA [Amorphus orientalis]MDQ0317009.1 DNA processing protein [Amorphus orientalis]